MRILVLTGPAKRDLNRIDAWTNETFGAAAARRYSARIIQLFNRIVANPDDWDSRAEPAFGVGVRSMSIRRVFGRGQHRAFYLTADQEVQILRVFHLASVEAAGSDG